MEAVGQGKLWVFRGSRANSKAYRSEKCDYFVSRVIRCQRRPDANGEQWRMNKARPRKPKDTEKIPSDGQQDDSYRPRNEARVPHDESKSENWWNQDNFDDDSWSSEAFPINLKQAFEAARIAFPVVLFFSPLVMSSLLWFFILLVICLAPPVRSQLIPITSLLWSKLLGFANKPIWNEDFNEPDDLKEENSGRKNRAYRGQKKNDQWPPNGFQETVSEIMYGPQKTRQPFQNSPISATPKRPTRPPNSRSSFESVKGRSGRGQENAGVKERKFGNVNTGVLFEFYGPNGSAVNDFKGPSEPEIVGSSVKSLPAPGEGLASPEREASLVPRGTHYHKVMVRVPRNPKYGTRGRTSRSEGPRFKPARSAVAGVQRGGGKWDYDSGARTGDERMESDQQGNSDTGSWMLSFARSVPFLRNWGGFL